MSKKIVLLIYVLALFHLKAVNGQEIRNYTYEEIKLTISKIVNSTYEVFNNVSLQAQKSLNNVYETTNEIQVCLAKKNMMNNITLIPEKLEAHLETFSMKLANITGRYSNVSIWDVAGRGMSYIFAGPIKAAECVANDTVTLANSAVNDLGDAVEEYIENSCGEIKGQIYKVVERLDELK